MLSTNIEISEKYFQENLSNTLTLFLNSLTEEKKKIVALNIYKNYILEINSSLSEKGYNLYKLYKKFKTGIFFKKWFVLTKDMNTFKTISKIKDNKSSLENTNNNTYNNTISYNISNIQNKYGKNIPNVNNSYNSSYNYSPSNGISNNKSSDIIVNLKNNSNNINLTRNHQYNLNIGKLIDSNQKKITIMKKVTLLLMIILLIIIKKRRKPITNIIKKI
jgi:predicted  nucleic acid-binding Zn-ribbon protein